MLSCLPSSIALGPAELSHKLDQVLRGAPQAGKLPVRGKFRVACLLIGSATVANIRRIERYLEGTTKAEKRQDTAPGQGENAPEQPGVSILASAKTALAAFLGWLQPQKLSLSW